MEKKQLWLYGVAAVGLFVLGLLCANLLGGGKFGAGTTVTDVSNLTVGGGQNIAGIFSATSSIDFAVINNGTCSKSTMTATGATFDSNNPSSVAIAVPAAMQSGYATSVSWTGWVSAANTVSIQGCAGTSTAMSDPPALVFGATVINH